MAVKRSKSGTRVLGVLEQIATSQPIGVSELARQMGSDRSAVQRAIMTLADEGWIHPAAGAARQWQLTGHIQLVAHIAQGSSSLRQRMLPAMAALRDATGETAFLTVPDVGRFVVLDVVESRHLLRTAPHVGMMVEAGGSATGLAVLPHLAPAEQAAMLGHAPDAGQAAGFADARAQGYAVSEDAQGGGSVNVAAALFERDGRPAGALVVSGPRERLDPGEVARIGALVARAARELAPARPESFGMHKGEA